MDPSADEVTVVRRKPGRWPDEVVERLELAHGKGWRLPRPAEVGRCAGAVHEVALDFDPGRTHRWVPV